MNLASDESLIPKLDELQVYEMISKAKKPKSGVPGDLPRTLTPLSTIYTSIIHSGLWPSSWKVESLCRKFQIPEMKTN